MLVFQKIFIVLLMVQLTYPGLACAADQSNGDSRVVGDIDQQAEQAADKSALWQGSIEAGLVAVTGNTQSEVANLGFNARRRQQSWTQAVKSEIYSAAYDGNRNAETYLLEGMLKYDLSVGRYLFSNARYYDNKFDSFTQIYSGALGAGFRPVGNVALSWDVYAGLGYSWQSRDVTQEDISGATFLGLSDYSQKISETTDFGLESRLEYKPENTFIRNQASINLAINETLSVKLIYELRYNSEPSNADENLDSLTKANVVYSF